MPGTYTTIATTTLGSDSATINFTSIPQTYDDLVLVSTYALDQNEFNLLMRFNSDSSNTYSETTLFWTPGNPGIQITPSATSYGRIGYFNSSYAPTNQTIVHIPQYAQTTTRKMWLNQKGPDKDYGMIRGVSWNSTSAITSINIFNESTTKVKSSSRFTLFGIRGA